MPWTPRISPGEVVLVACNTEARRRVPFHVILTDQQLIHARATVWSLDGMVTESQPLASVQEARIDKPRPFALWAFGALALLGFAVAVMLPSEKVTWFMAVSMLVAAGVAFGSAGKRVRLSWRASGRQWRLTTPASGNLAVRAAMTDALREIEQLLSDRGRLALKARDVRVEGESEQEPEEGDRRLCADGSCTGLVGDDGRCRICGLSG